MQEDRHAFAGQWHGANSEADARLLPSVAEAMAFMEERADVLRAVGFDAENQGYPLMGMGGWNLPPPSSESRSGVARRGRRPSCCLAKIRGSSAETAPLL